MFKLKNYEKHFRLKKNIKFFDVRQVQKFNQKDKNKTKMN